MGKPNLVPVPVREGEPPAAKRVSFGVEHAGGSGYTLERYVFSGSTLVEQETLHGPDMLGIVMGKLEAAVLSPIMAGRGA